MGLDAEVIAIGKLSILREHDVLEYPNSFYSECSPDTVVIGYVAGANATSQSQRLAELCGTEAWDFDTHHLSLEQLPKPDFQADMIGDEEEQRIYERVRTLLRVGVELWYLPNG